MQEDGPMQRLPTVVHGSYGAGSLELLSELSSKQHIRHAGGCFVTRSGCLGIRADGLQSAKPEGQSPTMDIGFLVESGRRYGMGPPLPRVKVGSPAFSTLLSCLRLL